MRRRRGGREDPVPLGDALRAVGRELGMAEPGALAALLGAWSDLVGTAVAAHARPRSLVDGVLTVAVDDPAWATELRFLEPEVRRCADEVVGPGQVRSLKVVVVPSKARREPPGLVD